MPANDQIQNLMLEIGQRNGIKIFTPDKDGVYVFNSEDKVNLSIRVLEDKNQVLLFSCLHRGELKDPAQYKKLLCANFLGLETQGATLASDPKTGDVLLCRLHPVQGLDGLVLEKMIGVFLNAAHEWHNRLALAPPKKETRNFHNPKQPDSNLFNSMA